MEGQNTAVFWNKKFCQSVSFDSVRNAFKLCLDFKKKCSA